MASKGSFHVLSAPASFEPPSCAPNAHNLLLRATTVDGVSRILLKHSRHGRLVLLIAPTTGKATALLEDATMDLQEAMSQPQTPSWHETFTHQGRVFLAVLMPSFSSDESDLGSLEDGPWWGKLSLASKKAGYGLRYHRKDPFSRASRLTMSPFLSVILLMLIMTSACFVLSGIAGPLAPENNNEPESVYDVGSSQGPKYTHLLTPDNITEWAATHYDPAKYFFRIDEQAMVPIELLDEQEMRYQKYLQERYPEKAEMRDSGVWLDPSFFHDPNNFMLPTDDEFHRGHCLRALRRYWQAKETGKHVCAWDIDYKHIHHCFSMLEGLMLPPGPRNPVGEYSMSWRTKVCSWEP